MKDLYRNLVCENYRILCMFCRDGFITLRFWLSLRSPPHPYTLFPSPLTHLVSLVSEGCHTSKKCLSASSPRLCEEFVGELNQKIP